jgi:XTP/dITP diphosphohydrolase
MLKNLCIATGNQNKVTEIRDALKGIPFNLISLQEVSYTTGYQFTEVEENGLTYYDNAKLKAEGYYSWTGLPTLADDSGIEVEGLNWGPGIHSARFAGLGGDNNLKLLNELANKDKGRAARMKCTLFLLLAPHTFIVTEGQMLGEIATEPKGQGGWGYEPIFYLPQYNCTVAEARDRGLEFVTHRQEALNRLKGVLLA